MPKKAEEKAREPDTPKKGQKRPRKDAEMTPGELRKANAKSPVNGQPVPKGRQFEAGDERAREAGRASGAARREKADLKRQIQLWMEEEVGTGKDGEKITGAQMMVRVAVKEVAKGNPRFWELLRDTAGFKPVDKVMMAEVEPTVIDEVERIVQEVSHE